MINKYSNIPLYSQLKSLIIKKIEEGTFKEDSQIPSEQEFCEKYEISRPTVRQAISELTNNGYLYKQKGKGTYVAKSKTKVDIKNYTGFTASILDSEDPGNKNIISVKKVVNNKNNGLEQTFSAMGSNAQQEGYAEIRYIVSHGSEVLSLNTSYIPLGLFPEIISDIHDKKPSYDILRGKYPLIPVRSKSSIEMVYTEQEEAQHLQIQPGCPLIRIDNVLYSKSGQAVELIQAKYRADKCKIYFENNK